MPPGMAGCIVQLLYQCSTTFKNIDSTQDCYSSLGLISQGIAEHCDIHGQAVPYIINFAVLLQ